MHFLIFSFCAGSLERKWLICNAPIAKPVGTRRQLEADYCRWLSYVSYFLTLFCPEIYLFTVIKSNFHKRSHRHILRPQKCIAPNSSILKWFLNFCDLTSPLCFTTIDLKFLDYVVNWMGGLINKTIIPSFLTPSQSALRAPTDDHQSDTSGETTTSDSGRGGSEEDIQLPPLPELHGME